MFYLAVQSYQLNSTKKTQKEFFISHIKCEQAVFATTVTFPMFSFPSITWRLFSFSGAGNSQSDLNPRFKMILWSIIAGTRGGVNRAKILNLIKDTPMNANKIATVLNLDHKTVVHHVKILSKNELVKKAEKDYGAEYHLTQIMKENQSALEEIMSKIGTK